MWKAYSFRISNTLFHCLWALDVAVEKSDDILILDTWWFFFSLEALRIYSLLFPSENSCPSFLEFFLNYLIDDFFPSGLLFQFSFFLKSISVLLCSNLLWFFPHFCDLLSNFQELFLVPPCFLKKFHPVVASSSLAFLGILLTVFFFFFNVLPTMFVSSIFLFLLFLLYYSIALFVVHD